MKKLLTAAALAAFALAPVAAQAAVDAIDWNGDGLNFANVGNTSNPYKPQQTFYDAAHNLLWTNGNVSGGVLNRPNTLYTWSESADFVANFNASTNLTSLNNEGLHTWHIPSRAEFEALVATQGMDRTTMTRLPFSLPLGCAWTSDRPINSQTTHFCFAGTAGSFIKLTDTVKTDVWLVTSVPEPETYAMLLAGLGVMGAVARRRQSKQA